DEDKPAARAFVHIDEIGASTSVDGAGRFTIRQVPAARPLTITATSDSGAAATASRYHVAINAGETLDVGSLDLAVCPPAATSLDYTNDAPARNFENGDWPSSGWGDR